MTPWDRLVRTGLSRVDIVKVRTAINPLLWLSAVTLLIGLGAMIAVEDHTLRLGLLAVGAMPVVAVMVAYVILLFRDPDRLQSEEYRIRQPALQILYRRGRGADIVDIDNQRPRMKARPSSASRRGPTSVKNDLLVLDDARETATDPPALLDRLDPGAELDAMDGQVRFIRTALDPSSLTDALLPLLGSRLFFLTEVSTADFSGRMVGRFWAFLKGDASVARAARC